METKEERILFNVLFGHYEFSAKKDADIIEAVLKTRGTVDCRDDDMRRTPLMIASTKSAECVALLLAKKANPEAMDLRGKRALHWAACYDSIRLLLKAHASPVALTHKGHTPLYTAMADFPTVHLDAILLLARLTPTAHHNKHSIVQYNGS